MGDYVLTVDEALDILYPLIKEEGPIANYSFKRVADYVRLMLAATKDVNIEHVKEFGVKYCKCSSIREGG